MWRLNSVLLHLCVPLILCRETSCLIKALNAACHQLLSRLSEHLTALSVFYRSQMGRGAGIKCIKCPLLSFMNGLKDLQSSVIRPSIIVTPIWNLRCWPQKKPWGCCHKEYNFICQVIHLNINTLSNGNTKRELNHDTRHYKLSQHLNTWSLPLRMLLQFNTSTPLFHSSPSFPLSCVAMAFHPAMQCRESCNHLSVLLIKQRFFEWTWIWYRLSKSCIRNNAASLQEAMFSVIHHRRGDTVSDCWDQKRLRPVCMCMKQFVRLYFQLTPGLPQAYLTSFH